MQNFTKDVYMLVLWPRISFSRSLFLSRCRSVSVCMRVEIGISYNREKIARRPKRTIKENVKDPQWSWNSYIDRCVCVCIKYTGSKHYDKNALPTDMGILVLTQNMALKNGKRSIPRRNEHRTKQQQTIIKTIFKGDNNKNQKSKDNERTR